MAKHITGSLSGATFLLKVFPLTTLILMFSLHVYSQPKTTADSAASQPFLGRWDLTLKTPGHDSPTWLEITHEGSRLKARMVSRWGHARPLPKVEISHGEITFVSPREEEERKDDMVFTGKLSGSTLEGTTTGPDGTPWQWTGVRRLSRERALLSGASRRRCSTART